jgi:hypothetical protein
MQRLITTIAETIALAVIVILIGFCGACADSPLAASPLPPWAASVVPDSAIFCFPYSGDLDALECVFASGRWAVRCAGKDASGWGTDHTVYWSDAREMPLLTIQGGPWSACVAANYHTEVTNTVTIEGSEVIEFADVRLELWPEQEDVRSRWAASAPHVDGPHPSTVWVNVNGDTLTVRYQHDPS